MSSPLSYMKIRRESPNNSFGYVRNNETKFHGGWDLYAKKGTPVMAIKDGIVATVGKDKAQQDDKVAYGMYVSIKFEFKDQVLYAFYAHLSEVSVLKDAEVKEGDIIGKTGNTGNAYNMRGDDEHLHFEVLTTPLPRKGANNKKMDPGRILGYEHLACKVQ